MSDIRVRTVTVPGRFEEFDQEVERLLGRMVFSSPGKGDDG